MKNTPVRPILKSPLLAIRGQFRSGRAFISAFSLLAALCGASWLPSAKAAILEPPDIIEFSTEYSGTYAAYNIFDNNRTDYASLGAGTDTYLVFQFPSPQTFNGIVVLNRDSGAGQDRIGSFTLTFDDGVSSLSLTQEPERGTGILHRFEQAVTATTVRLDVDSIGAGPPPNTGVMEMYFVNSPSGSSLIDSVSVIDAAPAFNAEYAAIHAADGKIGSSAAAGPRPEYASQGQGTATFVDFDLGASMPVAGFEWFDRLALADRVTAFDLIFSTNATFGDGDDVVQNYDNSAGLSAMGESFPAVNARYVRFQVVANGGAVNANTGMSEIFFYRSGGPQVVAPGFAAHPLAATRPAGDGYTFTVNATGSQPITYQWHKNGAPISGATGDTLVLANLQASDDANYSVTATNAAGSADSNAARLTVDLTPGNPDAGRVVHLTFNETKGLVAADAAGGDNPGALENFPGDNSQWQPGRFGGAISVNPLSPDGNVVLVEDPGTLDFSSTGVFSAACWVKAPAGASMASGAGIICKGTGGGGEQFCLDVSGGAYRFYVWNGGTPNAAFVLQTAARPNGEWQHLAIVFNQPQSRMLLYLNGEIIGERTTPDTLVFNASPVSIGARQSQGFEDAFYDFCFQGLIDDVRIYDRVLIPADIRAISPFIKTPPVGAALFQGQSHTFTAVGSGAEPLAYQWRKYGAEIAGATGASLAIANAQGADQGEYSVTITNPAGSITSTPVRLSVEVAPPDLTRGLLAHYPFDETSGLTAADAAGGNNPGALLNFAGDNSQWQPGLQGGALSFNSTGAATMEVVEITDSASLEFSEAKTFTLAAWVNASPDIVQIAGAGIICKGSGGGGEQFCLDVFPGNYRFYVWNGGTPNAATGVSTTVGPNGDWQHVAAVYDQEVGIMKLYVNGVEAGSAIPPSTLLYTDAMVSIGGRTPNAATMDYTLAFQGVLDDVRIYDRDLSPEEITLLSQRGPAGALPVLSVAKNGADVEISWPADVTGWTLQESTTLATAGWAAASGVVNNRLVVPAATGVKFYRLIRP